MKVVMPCSAGLTSLLVADLLILGMGLPLETGFFPMQPEFLAKVASGISTEPEVKWW